MTISTPPELIAASAALPRDESGPVFQAPWEAQAFALTLSMHAAGAFTWPEWASALASELALVAVPASGDCRSYYESWLAAIEKLITAKGIVSVNDLERRAEEWRAAAVVTPHGKPVELPER